MPDEEEVETTEVDSEVEPESDTDSDSDSDADETEPAPEDDRGIVDMFIDAGTFVGTGGQIDHNPDEGQSTVLAKDDD